MDKLTSPASTLLWLAGKAKYDAKKHALVWKIKRFDGQWELTLSASVERLSTTREKKAWGRPPISMSFQVNLFRQNSQPYRPVPLPAPINEKPILN
jgi:hypothetical protein